MISCDKCSHKEVCKFLSGEMLIRFKKLRKMDLTKEIRKLKEELAGKCSHYE